MAKNNWHGIMKVLEISHWDASSRLKWQSKNLYNILHQEGEEFFLRAAFTGGRLSDVIPEFYYLGLDNRSAIAITDTLDDLISEPQGGGYERQEVASSGDFLISFEDDHYIALSPIVAFRSTSSSWGPVTNLFLTDKADDTGYLISSIKLDSAISLDTDESVTIRLGMQLREC